MKTPITMFAVFALALGLTALAPLRPTSSADVVAAAVERGAALGLTVADLNAMPDSALIELGIIDAAIQCAYVCTRSVGSICQYAPCESCQSVHCRCTHKNCLGPEIEGEGCPDGAQ